MSAFPFLRLPKELRLIVYENIPIAEQECTIRESSHQAVTLRVRTLPTNILTTCRLIHKEAKRIFKSKLKELHSSPPLLILSSDIPRYQFFQKDKLLRGLIGAIDIAAGALRGELSDHESEESEKDIRSGYLFSGIEMSDNDTAIIMRFVQQSARQKFVYRQVTKPGFELQLDTTTWTLRGLSPQQNFVLMHCEALNFLLSMICYTTWIYLKIGFVPSSIPDPFVYAKRCLVKDSFQTCESSWYILETGMSEEQEQTGRDLLTAQDTWPADLDYG